MSDFESLDLTGSDPTAVGFPAIPSGTYQAHVGKCNWDETENIDGSKAMPHGTKYINVGIRVNEEEEPRNGQKVAGMYAGFTKLFIVPPDYDPGKAQAMKNRMANFLEAMGEDWQKKGYKLPDVDEFVGRPVTVIVRKKPGKGDFPDSNEIEGFKVAGMKGAEEAPAGALA